MKTSLDSYEKQDIVEGSLYAYLGAVIFSTREVFNLYVDLFFVWLLYRFMKPQKKVNGHKTEASVLLFAHDAQRAQQTLVEIYREDQDERRTETMRN